jgi:hypothetical protein
MVNEFFLTGLENGQFYAPSKFGTYNPLSECSIAPQRVHFLHANVFWILRFLNNTVPAHYPLFPLYHQGVGLVRYKTSTLALHLTPRPSFFLGEIWTRFLRRSRFLDAPRWAQKGRPPGTHGARLHRRLRWHNKTSPAGDGSGTCGPCLNFLVTRMSNMSR